MSNYIIGGHDTVKINGRFFNYQPEKTAIMPNTGSKLLKDITALPVNAILKGGETKQAVELKDGDTIKGSKPTQQAYVFVGTDLIRLDTFKAAARSFETTNPQNHISFSLTRNIPQKELSKEFVELENNRNENIKQLKKLVAAAENNGNVTVDGTIYGTSTIWRNVATTALALSTQQEQLDRQRGLINAMHVLEPSKEPEKEDEHHGLNTK